MSRTKVGNSGQFLVLMATVLISLLVLPVRARAGGELAPLGEPIFDAHVDDAWGVVVSPEGHHVYVTSSWRSGALVGFQRDPATGELQHIQTFRDNEQGSDGLGGPLGMAMSSDGRFLYVASSGDDAVSVFSRNGTSGLVDFVQVIKGGVLWNGLNGCMDLALSPDGASLYAVGRWDDTMVVFSVDAATGELSFVEVHRDGQDGLAGFDRPRRVTVSPDGSQVFVSARDSNTLFLFDRNPSDGTLTLARAWGNATDGLSILTHPSQIVFSDDGLNAYVGCQAGGFVVLAYNPGSQEWSVLEEHPHGAAPDYDLWGARNLALSPDQSRLYVSSDGSASVAVYRRDLVTGRVCRAARILRWRGVQNFGYPHEIAISPDGAHAYLAAGEDAVHCLSLRGEGGEISHSSVVFGGLPELQGLLAPTGLCVSPDGLNVYCPSRDEGGIITSFQRDPATGQLSALAMTGHCGDYANDHGLNDVEAVIAASNGRDVYSCSLGHDAIAHFRRDAVDGHLIFQAAYFNNSGITDMDSPHAIALSPDDRHLYAVGYDSDSIVSFEVGDDGGLVFLESLVNGSGDFDRLDGPTNLCLSPDGHHLYVAAHEDDAVVVFSRDETTGLLTYEGFVSDDLGGVDGLDRIRCVQVSPDGRHLYAGAFDESKVACFTRDAGTGMLAFIEAKPTYWRLGRGMAFNSDGTRLYVPFTGSATLVAFRRDPTTGQLLEADLVSGNPPVPRDGMREPHYVAVSPDDQNLYLSCYSDACVQVFSLSPTP